MRARIAVQIDTQQLPEISVGRTRAEVRRWQLGRHLGDAVSGDIWQRFTAALDELAADVPGLTHVVPGPGAQDAAGRYRDIRRVLSEIAVTATELDDARVHRWLTSDATAAVVTSAATEALEADGLVVDRGMDADAHLRRALHWRRYSRGATDDLRRNYARDLSRGSLRLLAQCGAGRGDARLELQRTRLELARDVRRQFGELQADLLVRVPSARGAVSGFEADVRRELAETCGRIRAATAVALGTAEPARRWSLSDVPAPVLAQRPDEMWLGVVLGAGFGLGSALGLARMATGLAGIPEPIGAVLGMVLGLTLTVAVIGVRTRLHRRAVLDRWVGTAVAAVRQASEEELAYRLVEAQIAGRADHKSTN
ncbi:hypothetical protein [Mycolicibacterium sp. CBMA 234]|uniref:hypothetical protein n=1 Tax=Mycolicibacterium sp. CBMA 234 TaxID=1918495 RepID=UPI0012DF666C|nr:hypothetical protein [Mycolicibacterium sp. CBMA 234]